MYTCVSARTILRGTVSSVSSESDPSHKAENLLAQQGSWITKKSDSIQSESLVLDFKESAVIGYIALTAGSAGPEAFPADFRIELR